MCDLWSSVLDLNTVWVPLICLNGIYCLVCELRLHSAWIAAPDSEATFPEMFSPSAACLQSISLFLLPPSVAAWCFLRPPTICYVGPLKCLCESLLAFTTESVPAWHQPCHFNQQLKQSMKNFHYTWWYSTVLWLHHQFRNWGWTTLFLSKI